MGSKWCVGPTPATSVAHPVLFKDESSRKEERERREGRETENPETKAPSMTGSNFCYQLTSAELSEKATCLILSRENPFFTVNLHLKPDSFHLLDLKQISKVFFLFVLFLFI